MTNKNKNIKLNEIGNKMPFKTPDNYFESLTDRIMDKVDSEAKITVDRKIVRFTKPMLAFAASFVIIFTLIYIPVKIFNPKTTSQQNTSKEIDLMNYYYLNDQDVMYTSEEVPENNYNDEVMEMILLASVSDIELLEMQN